MNLFLPQQAIRKHLFLKALILCLFLFYNISSKAQIILSPNATANALIDRLAGSGITYTNALLTCPSNASGKFDNGLASSVLMDSGIVLTTGKAQTTGTNYGVNGIGSNFASINNNTNGGDANLATAANTAVNNLHDLCKLEFDFIPTGDTIQFRYRFGSEEYPAYNCTNYNDIFAFFISGPGYALPTNVALVPGTSIPVSINSINNGTINVPTGGALANCTALGAGSPFTSFYVNTSASTSVTYNGLTSILTAKAAVTPCSTYHMKFAIADVTDHLYDSGVFLEAGSFSSDIASVVSISSSNSISSPTPFAIEGCSPAVITLSRPTAKPYSQIVTYSLSGTATNGTDITTLTGSATIPANGTTTSITITALADGLAEGTETLIFSINGSLCSNAITETVTVNILDYPKYTKPLNDTICAGQSTTLSVNPIPANANLTFTWTPSGSLNTSTGVSVIATPSTTTTYTVTSSYPGCPLKDSTFTITVDQLPNLNVSSTNVTCNGLQNGSITATGSVSIPPLSVTLMPSGASSSILPFTFNNLAPNTYTVTLSSGSGCIDVDAVTISAPSAIVWNTVQKTNPLCSGSNNGSIQANAGGGAGSINYTLLPNNVTNMSGNFSLLTSGTYTINAVDGNGCSNSTIVLLSSANGVTWTSVSSSNVTPCYGNSNGTVNALASGGSGAITYLINPGGNTNVTGSFTSLNAGTYTIIASDINGCSNTTFVTITQPLPLQINATIPSPVLCNGNTNGTINITASGGSGTIQYTLLPTGVISTAGSFTNLSAGIYTILVADANSCSSATTTSVTQPATIQVSSFSINNITCNGGNNGSINTSYTGGTGNLNYTLQPLGTLNTSGSFTNLSAGSYTVIISDANGCSASTSVSIQQPALLQFVGLTTATPSCNGSTNGFIHISSTGGTGGIVYDLLPSGASNTSGIFNGLGAGTYTIIASDIVGCSSSTIITIMQPAALQFNAVTITNPSCTNTNNGSISCSAIGGTPSYLYALNANPFTGTSNYPNLIAGNYILHLKDSKGCIKDSQVNLQPAYNLTFNNVIIQSVLCKFGNTGSITIGTSGGFSPYLYTLNGVSTGTNSNFLNLGSGNYSIHVSDNNGCIRDTILSVSEPLTPLAFNAVNTVDILCYGTSAGSITATATGGTSPYQYSLNNGTFQTTGNFTSLIAGLYSITLKDNNGCLKDTTITIHQPLAPLVLTLKNLKEITCIGLKDAEIKVGVTGGVKPYSFSINGVASITDSTFANLSAGNYLIEVIDSNGCKTDQTYTIAIPTKRPYIVIENIFENVCKDELNGMIDWTGINGFQPYKYTVNAVFMDTTSFLQNLGSGNYLIQLVDQFGCKADTTIELKATTTLEVNINTTPASCAGEGNDGKAIAVVNGGTTPYIYNWIGLMGNTQEVENIKYGSHIIIVTDASNCSDTANYTIDYIPCCEVYMPNAFSPNEDGNNDIYRFINHGIINVKSFDIFDRWGKKIFHTTNLEEGWDGKLIGVDYEIGTYYYLLKYTCQLSSTLILKKGEFTLLR